LSIFKKRKRKDKEESWVFSAMEGDIEEIPFFQEEKRSLSFYNATMKRNRFKKGAWPLLFTFYLISWVK
jgi:hypothetical protein